LLFQTVLFSQKKTIDHTAYDRWNSLKSVTQSESGEWLSYEINPLEGDGVLYIESTSKEYKQAYPRGKSASISFNEQFIAFLIKPQFDTLRQLKLDKVKKIKHPKDTLAIYWTATDSVAKYPNVKSFKIPKEGEWVAYLSTKDLRPKKSKKKKKKKKCKNCEPVKTSGHTLFLFNPINGLKKKIHRVVEYSFDKTGKHLAYTTSVKGDKDSLTVHMMTLEGFHAQTLIVKELSIKKMTFDFDGDQFIFMSSSDTSKQKNYSLSYWNSSTKSTSEIINEETTGMPTGWTVSGNSYPYFSRNGERIFIGSNEVVEAEDKDTLLASEKYHVDIWSGSDLRIQPQQLKNLQRDKNKSYLGVYHIADKKYIQLANPELENVRTQNFSNANFAIGSDSRAHQRERNWAFPWASDYYLVNVTNGKKELLKAGLKYSTSISPSGEHFVWYNGADSSWQSISISAKTEMSLSSHLKTNFAEDANGMPYQPYPEGNRGWAKVNDIEYFVVKDFNDVWFLHPSDTTKTFCLTNQEGKKKNMRYDLMRLNYDSLYIDLDDCLVKGIDDKTKDESIYEISEGNGAYSLNRLLSTPHKITYFQKAKKSDKVVLRRMSFTEYPEIETTNLKLENIKKISSTNPQQKEYNWATVEFVEWKAYDSTALRGLLYKPEDFDPNKSYPMLVYFYETYQDNIHYYYPPKPTASIIYATEYASSGYIVFIPDVRYKEGHPAKSAYNCIVSGTDYLVNKYDWIDSTRLGLQGQSWGGYQTAQLITMTNKYKAAMAGAPVSNMFSAYGGIRWGSGMSRMFQYERTQSRIGYTIWERPDLYIENSPVFALPNVTTSLLIMHNDNDGAVPWYQGIELFMGLRRLDKTVWLLNYNDDQHNLTKLPNKRDLSIRMKQFFNYYLLDADMPAWMKNGLPAVDKGVEDGYELTK
jgi:dipeptidyl aminopeptidase/acylaminoacyl peptidase